MFDSFFQAFELLPSALPVEGAQIHYKQNESNSIYCGGVQSYYRGFINKEFILASIFLFLKSDNATQYVYFYQCPNTTPRVSYL